ncbi:PREDICTED: taste receptor type 2 member 39-like [Nanorana parkeri]|uniref:taste receptor type 2 member 39-like n=1 Tax=Nanorana parkeri TaxID=125878 RepID=UPI000854306C|nr:PREDICTED: taste receptor type 2 member 39-like [Nanorana parkeri]
MLTPVVGVTVHSVICLIGLIGNAFILIVHFLDWLKTYEFNPCDIIINSISISNMFLQAAILFNEVCYYMFLLFYAQKFVINSTVVIMASLAFCSLWCSTCLCFYYCVKITNFSGTLFHKLKSKLPRMVPWMLIISIAMSSAAGIPAYWDLYLDIPTRPINFTRNMTLTMSFNLKSRCNCLYQFYMLFSGVAFVIIFFTAGAIITSLCKHMIRMRQNSEGSGTGKINSHLSAAKTVTSLLLLYLIFYGTLNLIFNDSSSEVGSLLFSFCFIVVASFPTINSIILIMGNRKLTNVFKKLLGIRSVAGSNSEVTGS